MTPQIWHGPLLAQNVQHAWGGTKGPLALVYLFTTFTYWLRPHLHTDSRQPPDSLAWAPLTNATAACRLSLTLRL